VWLVIEFEKSSGHPTAAIDLNEGETLVGRSPDCHVVIGDRSVSRRHVRLRRSGTEVRFADCGSRTGTKLNGVAADEGILAIGKRLAIGRVILHLEVDQPAGCPVMLSARNSSDQKLDVRKLQDFLAPLGQAADPKSLLERLLAGLVDIYRAQRGFVLLRERPNQPLIPVATHRVPDMDQFFSVSRTVYEHAIEAGKAIAIENSHQDDRWSQAKSLIDADWPRTIYCAPLLSPQCTLGVIYLDRSLVAESHSSPELDLLETIAGLASQLLTARTTRDDLLTARGRIQQLSAQLAPQEPLILGPSPASAELESIIAAAAPKDVSVLITGETGTGKEMVARTLHDKSTRALGPFVPVNCAALPKDIIEAELFGVEKGAFTGATSQRPGRFEIADGGTLFLDEVGELPLDTQVKLLRVLQERSVTRVGGTKSIPLDFRLVCATNTDIEAAIQEGSFRQDFFYRINVFRIRLVPLRDRSEDIEGLALHFLETFSLRYRSPTRTFSDTALEIIKTHRWEGNIRELRNAIERAVVVEKESSITPESLPFSAPVADDGILWAELPHEWETAKEAFERTFLQRRLTQYQGNISAMAKATGMPRRTIYRRLEQYGLIKK